MSAQKLFKKFGLWGRCSDVFCKTVKEFLSLQDAKPLRKLKIAWLFHVARARVWEGPLVEM